MTKIVQEPSQCWRIRRFSCLFVPVSLLLLCVSGTVHAQWNPLNPVISVERESGGVQLALEYGALRLEVCSDSIIRVRYSPTTSFRARPEFVVIKDRWPATKWEMQSAEDAIVVSTSQLKVVVARKDNTNISIPLLLSSDGYGIFWNNASRSRFNNRFLNALYLSSEVADVLDYYFLYGPEFDKVIGGYRELTGRPPMFGKWAYGFWQCKNKYNTEEELLGVAHKYRQQHIPADNIVQDWFWWYTMGEPVFDKARYPDPPGMVEDLHKNKFHLMISFWPYFRPGTKTYEAM